MLFIPTITILLATLAAAVPSKRHSEPNVTLVLANDAEATNSTYDVSPESGYPRVIFIAGFTIDSAALVCRTNCTPEFRCNLAGPAATLRLGSAEKLEFTPGRKVYAFSCGLGRQIDIEPRPAVFVEAGSAEP